jgi:iron-sulfur cluster assembly enzyme ISCU, mitochondrial
VLGFTTGLIGGVNYEVAVFSRGIRISISLIICLSDLSSTSYLRPLRLLFISSITLNSSSSLDPVAYNLTHPTRTYIPTYTYTIMLRPASSSTPRVTGRAISAASRSATRPAIRHTSPAIVPSQRQYHMRTYTRPVASQVSPAIVSGRRHYHEKVLDHYSRPRNVGSMPKTDTDVGTGLVGAPACGDVMKLQIRVDPSNNTISDVKFKTFGCGSAIASSSYLTELVRGMTLEEAGRVRNTEIAKELCLPPVKRKFQFLFLV